MTARVWLMLVLAATSCKAKEQPPAPAVGSGSAPPVAIAPPDAAADAPPAPPPTPDASVEPDRCASPCLFLVDTPLEKVATLVETTCPTKTLYTDDADCEERLYALNCIYAARGKVFKTPAWKDVFTALPWYKPNPQFVDKELTGLPLENVRALKEQYNACKASMVTIDPADIAIAKAFVNRIATSSTDDELPEFARGLDMRNMHADDNTKFTYARAPQNGRRVVTAKGFFYAVGGGEARPDAEVTVVIEGDKVVDIQ